MPARPNAGAIPPIRIKTPAETRRPMLLALAFLFLAVLTLKVSAQEPVVSEADRVHFGDLIDVDVIGSVDFDWRGKLNPEGFLDGLDTYGDPVYGLCRTESEIAAAVTRAYSRLLRDPKVVVRILDRSDRAVVTLEGAVRKPQRYQLRRAVHLRELLVYSGGISDDAGGDIQVFRPPNLSCSNYDASNGRNNAETAGPQITTIKIGDILKGKPGSDPEIKSGDLVTVLRVVPIYVIGGVNDPKPISSRPGLTLSRAIAMAGGIAKEGDRGRVTIYRREGSSAATTDADLDSIASGKATDLVLKPLDIVEVAQKGRAKRKYAPVIRSADRIEQKTLPLRIVD